VIMDPAAAEPPVVSRSTTQKVTSRSGRPSSSKVRCDSHRAGFRARSGVAAVVMSETVDVATDETASPRGIPWVSRTD
jgi:hypothetical protein